MKKNGLIIIILFLLLIFALSGCFDSGKQNSGTVSPNDSDGDGLSNDQEAMLGTNDTNPDTDDDGIYDYFETDDGNATDTDGDGIIDVFDTDDDGDTIATVDEKPDKNGDGNPADALDTDDDGVPNYLDNDDDNDKILTDSEKAYSTTFGFDIDNDDLLNYLDFDSDNDGKPDSDEGTADNDGDGVPNFLDSNDNDGPLGDLDFDGVTNEEEDYSEPIPPDEDNDGTPDYLDPETNGSSGGPITDQEKFIGSWHNMENEDEHWIFYSDGTQKYTIVVVNEPPGESYIAELWFDYTLENGSLCQIAFSNYGGVPSCYEYQFSEDNNIVTLFNDGDLMLRLEKD